MNITTRYGVLDPVSHIETDAQGAVLSCVPAGALTLDTPWGRLTPQHTTDDMRRPKVEPLLFYPDGTLRSIALEQRTPIATPLGEILSELLNFYPDGSLRRVFPLNGKLSGYWTEKEEESLCGPLSLDTPAGAITARVVGVQFHPHGRLRSVTLWPGEVVEIDTPLGRQRARVGMAFHPGGQLRSFEPERMLGVPTPIGRLEAFDPDVLGIHGDCNSLCFTPDGSVEAVATPLNTVQVTLPDGSTRGFSPERSPSLCDERVQQTVPLRISFPPGKVEFGTDVVESFPMQGHAFKVGRLLMDILGPISYNCGM